MQTLEPIDPEPSWRCWQETSDPDRDFWLRADNELTEDSFGRIDWLLRNDARTLVRMIE